MFNLSDTVCGTPSVFSDIREKGLNQTLTDLNYDFFAGFTFESTMDFLLVYCSSGDAGMDETAANMAFAELAGLIALETGNDLEAFEAYISQAAAGDGLSQLLCKFWGLYIFEHLAQRFQEKITQTKGKRLVKKLFALLKKISWAK